MDDELVERKLFLKPINRFIKDLAKPYCNAPDGKECMTKMVACMNLSGIAGVCYGVFNVFKLRHTHPVAALGTLAFHAFPFFVSGATFALTSCNMISIGKHGNTPMHQLSEHYSYFVGGLSAGAVLGIYYSSAFVIGAPVGVIAGISAHAMKYKWDTGYRFPPRPWKPSQKALYERD